jgi:uncharacterized membrane protein YphA (DoxX/SURF4 family)
VALFTKKSVTEVCFLLVFLFLLMGVIWFTSGINFVGNMKIIKIYFSKFCKKNQTIDIIRLEEKEK